MRYLITDKQGNYCAAKTAYIVSLAVMLYLAITIKPELLTEFLTGAAAFLASVGAVYWGRNKDKGSGNNTSNIKTNN